MTRWSDLGEKDRKVSLLTPEFGRLEAVARGARRPTSTLAGRLQPFTHVRLLLWRGRSLDGISQAEVLHAFPMLRTDFATIAYASVAVEAVEAFFHDPRDGARLYRLLLFFLEELEQELERTPAGVPGALLRSAEEEELAHRLLLSYLFAQVIHIAGLTPRWGECSACGRPLRERRLFVPALGDLLCPDCVAHAAAPGLWLGEPSGRLLAALAASGPRTLERLRPGNETLNEALRALAAFLEASLERSLNSLPFIDIMRASK